ncbi:hypothetical protein AB0L57_31285 [Nocardia sp. NPDC052254]|uniref:hypothetical protein n=1 Tax=Nocardia sp. NPDC052254 TaxID=3155681 RepID=UPI00343A2A19
MTAVAILGATGRTGRLVVDEARSRGFCVTAVVRGAGSLGPARGEPRISPGARGKVGPRISRADLAAYLLDAIDDPSAYRTAVAVSS